MTGRPASIAWLLLLCCALVACGESSSPAESGDAAPSMESGTPGTVKRGDSTTDLATTPLSAADYALYAAVMSGASAMLSTLSPEDLEAIDLAAKVDAGVEKATPEREPLLARARQLREKDLELARLQGVEDRYRQVKARVEAVIGPSARPPAEDDAVARENLRFLEAHRANIERLQRILRDPRTRPPVVTEQ